MRKTYPFAPLILIVLVLFSVFALYKLSLTQPGIYGWVKSSKGYAIKGAKIIAFGSLTYTNADGYYEIPLQVFPGDIVVVTAYAKNHELESKTVQFVDMDGIFPLRVDFILNYFEGVTEPETLAPIIQTLPAEVSGEEVILNGAILDMFYDEQVFYWFRWGLSPDNLIVFTPQDKVAEGVGVYTARTSLSPGTYYYEFVVDSYKFGRILGGIRKFKVYTEEEGEEWENKQKEKEREYKTEITVEKDKDNYNIGDDAIITVSITSQNFNGLLQGKLLLDGYLKENLPSYSVNIAKGKQSYIWTIKIDEPGEYLLKYLLTSENYSSGIREFFIAEVEWFLPLPIIFLLGLMLLIIVMLTIAFVIQLT